MICPLGLGFFGGGRFRSRAGFGAHGFGFRGLELEASKKVRRGASQSVALSKSTPPRPKPRGP